MYHLLSDKLNQWKYKPPRFNDKPEGVAQVFIIESRWGFSIDSNLSESKWLSFLKSWKRTDWFKIGICEFCIKNSRISKSFQCSV